MTQPADTKLARRLQARGVWPSYTACLTVVRSWLTNTEKTPKEIREAIDAGQLDPTKEHVR